MRRETRALVAYFLIAFVPPSIGWSLLTFGMVPPSAPYAPLLYLTGWGASLGGLIATQISEGFPGVRRLLGQAVRIAVPVQWWLYVLVVPPAAQACAALLTFVAAGKPLVVDPAALAALASPALLIPFFFGPFGEEFGWRGFLLPRLVRRFGTLPAAMILGVIWAAWHWPLEWRIIAPDPARQLPSFLIATVGMSIMIAAVYLRTNSLLLAMLMHWNFDSMLQLSPKLFPGAAAVGGSGIGPWIGPAMTVVFAALSLPALLAAGRTLGRQRSLA